MRGRRFVRGSQAPYRTRFLHACRRDESHRTGGRRRLLVAGMQASTRVAAVRRRVRCRRYLGIGPIKRTLMAGRDGVPWVGIGAVHCFDDGPGVRFHLRCRTHRSGRITGSIEDQAGDQQ